MMIFLLFEKPETMLKNIFFIFWILFQSFAEINCQIKPKGRYHHTTTLINDKLYILGGMSTVNSFIWMSLFHLILKIYHGKIYQA